MSFEKGDHKKLIKENLARASSYGSREVETFYTRDLRNLIKNNSHMGFLPGQAFLGDCRVPTGKLVDLSGDYSTVNNWGLLKVCTFEKTQEQLDRERFNCTFRDFSGGGYMKGKRKDAFYSQLFFKTDLFVPLFIRPVTQSELPSCSNIEGKTAFVFDQEYFLNVEEFFARKLDYLISGKDTINVAPSFPENGTLSVADRFLQQGVSESVLLSLDSFVSQNINSFRKVCSQLEDSIYINA